MERGDKETNPTVKYSFVNLQKLIDVYTAGDNSITIDGYSVSVKISQTAGNLLSIANDGLFVGSDPTKIDKVTNAVAGNFATWGLSGALVDSGATSIAGGASGLVPAPSIGDENFCALSSAKVLP